MAGTARGRGQGGHPHHLDDAAQRSAYSPPRRAGRITLVEALAGSRSAPSGRDGGGVSAGIDRSRGPVDAREGYTRAPTVPNHQLSGHDIGGAHSDRRPRRRRAVLFIEDSPTLAQLLESASNRPATRSSGRVGREGLELARAGPPDLLLCDVRLPGIDGFEVVRVLRRELATANMSIIMLTAMANVMEGLDAGADDYVLKPYDHRELLARVRSVLRRAKAMRALSPLTGLPGNTRIQEELERAIRDERQFALLYADLDNFKAYNDHYGFARGDDILRLAARLLHGAVQATARPDAFVGHVGGDDFVAITAEEAAKAVVEDLIERFDRQVPSLYDPRTPSAAGSRSRTAVASWSGSRWSRSRSGSPPRRRGASATTRRRSPPPPR